MKKFLFLTATLCILLTVGINAQQKGPRERMTPEQQATRTVERLNQELKLTDAQQKDLKKMFTESFKKREETFQKNKENREETDAQLKKILTTEQYKTYKENEEKRQQERQQRRPAHQNRNHGSYPRN